MFRLVILAISLLFTYSGAVHAQNLYGIVKEAVSRLPIANVYVISSKKTVLTDSNGVFLLNNVNVGDRIAVRMMGYETAEVIVNRTTDTLLIYLKQDAIALKEVNIKTNRNYKVDSLALRKEYANVFAYKGPSFSDAFIERDPSYNSPFGFSNPRSTASIVSLNVLQVFNLIGRKKTQTTKLKEILLRDEELNYIDEVFSAKKVKLVTGLEGEELTKFMNLYRPSIITLKKMTGYELTLYIKKSHDEFKRIKP